MFAIGFQYYRYTRKLGVDAGYPKPLSLWRGLPIDSTVNAALQVSNSSTYFFTGQHFYRFNDVAFNVRKLSIHYPAATNVIIRTSYIVLLVFILR